MSTKGITVSIFYFKITMDHISLLGDECESLSEGDQSFSEDIEYVNMTWYETPSIVSFPAGKYPGRDSRDF